MHPLLHAFELVRASLRLYKRGQGTRFVEYLRNLNSHQEIGPIIQHEWRITNQSFEGSAVGRSLCFLFIGFGTVQGLEHRMASAIIDISKTGIIRK